MSHLDNILDIYHRVLESHAVPFAPIQAQTEWHLTVFYVPSFCREAIIDIDCRDKETLIYRTRFAHSVWEKVREASLNRGTMASFAVERACERLPKKAPIHEVVEEEIIFRLSDGKAMGTDGEVVIVIFTYPGGVFRRRCWKPRSTGNAVWHRVLEAVDDAGRGLPPLRLGY